MKKLHFILILFIVLFAPNVFAQEVNVTNNCYGSTGYSGMYNGQEVQYQTYNPYNFGTTYQFQLSSFETELRYNLIANTDYTITINTNNTNDFRNNFRTYNVYDLDHNSNNLVKSFTYVSMKKVQITFKTTVATSRVQIQMGGSNVYDNITGETNWNIKSVILTIPDSAPSGSTNQDIIDNQTNNTNNIINNNNQNTSDIINNNNENTNKVVDNQKELLGNKCPNILEMIGTSPSTCVFSNDRKSVSCNGFNNDTYFFIKNMTSPTDDDYTLSFTASGVSTNNIKYTITGSSGSQYTLKNGVNTIHIPKNTTLQNSRLLFDNVGTTSNSYNINFSNFILTKGSNYVPWCEFGSFTSKLDETNSSINNINDSINDFNVDNGTGQGFFDNFTSQDFGLSQIITIPLNTIQGLTSKSCVPLQVPIPFTNSNLSLPCMTEIYQNKMPTIYNLWKIVSFGIVAYLIAIDIFHIVKGFKDPESDKVEVLDL